MRLCSEPRRLTGSGLHSGLGCWERVVLRPKLSCGKLAQVEGSWGVPSVSQAGLGAVASDLRPRPRGIPTQSLSSQCSRVVLQPGADSPRSRLYTSSMEPSPPHTLLGECWAQALDGRSPLQAHRRHLSCQDWDPLGPAGLSTLEKLGRHSPLGTLAGRPALRGHPLASPPGD